MENVLSPCSCSPRLRPYPPPPVFTAPLCRRPLADASLRLCGHTPILTSPCTCVLVRLFLRHPWVPVPLRRHTPASVCSHANVPDSRLLPSFYPRADATRSALHLCLVYIPYTWAPVPLSGCQSLRSYTTAFLFPHLVPTPPHDRILVPTFLHSHLTYNQCPSDSQCIPIRRRVQNLQCNV